MALSQKKLTKSSTLMKPSSLILRPSLAALCRRMEDNALLNLTSSMTCTEQPYLSHEECTSRPGGSSLRGFFALTATATGGASPVATAASADICQMIECSALREPRC